MLGHDGHGGLGGLRLQDNKVAIVWPEKEPAQFRFCFLQVVPSTGTVLPMECSNSSSASAMLAQLGGHHRGQESQWRAVNISTGQKIELRPNSDHHIADAWTVRFLVSARTRKALAGVTGDHHVQIAGKRITFRPVLVGNLFLFSELDPETVDAHVAGIIADAGMRVARDAGFAPQPGYSPKVIPYRICSIGSRSEVHAASYYQGELHRSFPGSASMALCAFLATKYGNADPVMNHWRICHPSGVIDVTLGFDTSRNPPKLEWTEFVTPVSLLAWGSAAMPWRRKG
ncbi:MAG: hypothetical protein ACU837_08080 [Gammaproteobacteria bacterium]